MKAFLTHYWNNNREEILAKSCAHCHCRGLHSVMLSSVPGRTVRLFYAAKDHELWKNCMEKMPYGLSVGFHPHHCAVTLQAVVGTFWNWTVKWTWDGDPEGLPVCEYRFDSKLNGGKGSFTLQKTAKIKTDLWQQCDNGRFIEMGARDLHSVYVPRDEVAAWFVFEGKEDPEFKPLCYSNCALETFDASGLYKQISPDAIREILRACGAQIAAS